MVAFSLENPYCEFSVQRMYFRSKADMKLLGIVHESQREVGAVDMSSAAPWSKYRLS